MLQLGLFLSNINFCIEVQSYGKLSYLRLECMLGAVVTPSGQSVNQSVYIKSVRRRRTAIADTYRAEENAASSRVPKVCGSMHFVYCAFSLCALPVSL